MPVGEVLVVCTGSFGGAVREAERPCSLPGAPGGLLVPAPLCLKPEEQQLRGQSLRLNSGTGG